MSDWRRVEEIVHAALERSPGERLAFVREAASGDEALVREVESLLTKASVAEKSTLRIGNLGLELTGQQIGVYRVDSLIGAGGMGEVYRARDTKLGRDVALKILPPGFTSDAERLARFEREARVLASLNHPAIAAIYGFEHSGPTPCLVLELIEGPTLADRIAQRPLPMREAIGWARQIVDGLEACDRTTSIRREQVDSGVYGTDHGTHQECWCRRMVGWRQFRDGSDDRARRPISRFGVVCKLGITDAR
jgi:serine/threonine protein kinase